MAKDQDLSFQRGPRPEKSEQRRPNQAANFFHKIGAWRNSVIVGSRVGFPTGTGVNQMPVIRDRHVVGMLSREDVITFLRTLQEFGGTAAA